MDEIRLTQAINAPVERIWNACATVDGLMAWQADEASGELVPGASVRLGWPALGVELELEVERVVAGERVVLAARTTTLELVVEPGKVTLIHGGVGRGDEREGVTSSWRLSLGLLAHYCERHHGKRRHVRWLAREASTSPATAHVFFTDEHALSTWLGRGGPIGMPGDEFSFELGAGDRMTGRVLANSPGRDVAISWEEDEGSALCLRTLPRPAAPTERLIVLSWSRWSTRPPERARLEWLDAAHHRLTQALDGASDA